MIVRLFGLVVLLWCLGFAAFMLVLPRPLNGLSTDAIVVPTGGPGRIGRGLALLEAKQARRMLITGTAPGVVADDLAREYDVSRTLFACCVDLGGDAVDTRSNARETARWVGAHGFQSVRLVTSDWHMARAKMELKAVLGNRVTVIGDGVTSSPPLTTLVNEYNKLILRRIALWAGIGA